MTDLKRRDDRQEPGPVEKAFMVLSVLVTLSLFGYVAYQGVMAPDTPDGTVVVTGTKTVADGVEVDVRLDNKGSVGYRSVTVEVDCGEIPPQVTLENVPAQGRRTATLLCPPGTDDPSATVAAVVPT